MLQYLFLGIVLCSVLAWKKSQKVRVLGRFITQYIQKKIYPEAIIINDRCVKIRYYFNDSPYTVYLPYNKTLRMMTMGKNVYAVSSRGIENITQQSCVPYFVTPNMLGVSHFLVDTDDGQNRLEGDQMITPESFS